MGITGSSNLRFFRAKERDKIEIFMTDMIMMEEIIKKGMDQIVEIGEFNLVDKVEVDQGMNKIIGEEILEAMQDCIKILEDRIVEKNIEVTIGMKIIAEKEVEVGLEKDHFQGMVVIKGIIEE